MIPARSRSCYTGMGNSLVSKGYFSPTSHVLSRPPFVSAGCGEQGSLLMPTHDSRFAHLQHREGIKLALGTQGFLWWTHPPSAGMLQQGADGFRKKIPRLLSRSSAQSPHAGKGEIIPQFKKKQTLKNFLPCPKLLHTCINTKLAKPMEKDFAFWQQSWLRAHCGPYPKPTGAEGACTDFNGPWAGSGWEESASLHPWGRGVISSFCSAVSPNMWCCNRYLDLHQSKWIRVAL